MTDVAHQKEKRNADNADCADERGLRIQVSKTLEFPQQQKTNLRESA